MRTSFILSCFTLCAGAVLLTGCKSVKGERFWWDDQKKEELPDTYTLPDWPAEAPLPTDPEPYVPRNLPDDEIKRAREAQLKRIEAGVPRTGVPDPETDRVKVPVAAWEGDAYSDAPSAPVRSAEELHGVGESAFDD